MHVSEAESYAIAKRIGTLTDDMATFELARTEGELEMLLLRTDLGETAVKLHHILNDFVRTRPDLCKAMRMSHWEYSGMRERASTRAVLYASMMVLAEYHNVQQAAAATGISFEKAG